jgi:hypothetical protein
MGGGHELPYGVHHAPHAVDRQAGNLRKAALSLKAIFKLTS